MKKNEPQHGKVSSRFQLCRPACFLLSLFLVCLGTALVSSCRSTPKQPVVPLKLSALVDLDPERLAEISYTRDVQPLLNARCVSCHACFDAPAQLKLESLAGLERGATKARVYNGGRLTAAPPTRLGEDARTVEQWREMGFFSVLADPDLATPEERLDGSVFYQMLAMAQLRQLPQGGFLDAIVRDSHDIPQAPTLEEMPAYIQNFPHAGMPFYTYGLTNEEFSTLAHWIAAGTPVDLEEPQFSPEIHRQIADWEALLNGTDPRDRLIARYLYEHLFAAHLYFKGEEEQGFFSLIRSSMPPGVEPERIVTRRPNDSPGEGPVYYRLVPVTHEITRKSHLPFGLSEERMNRWKTLFWDSEWDTQGDLLYGPKWSQRPFEVFQDIPEASRYAFLLDHSYYFVLSFMRGPVCRGQLALNGIWDHFFVYFRHPAADLMSHTPEFREEITPLLVLPTSVTGGDKAFGYKGVMKKAHQILDLQNRFLMEAPLAEEEIWTGAREGDVPFMTAFRHFDTASVAPGFLGDTPAYGWYVDYALLERIYYLLVVNYDVFGSVGHQLATRKYFDYLRYEGESAYLRLFPEAQREAMFDYWYRDVSKGTRRKDYPMKTLHTPLAIPYPEDRDPRQILRERMERQFAYPGNAEMVERFQRAYAELPQATDPFIQYFPEVVFVRIRHEDGENSVLTLLRNKALKNVAHLFGEGKRREPEQDTLLVVHGLVGDYPNLMMDLHESELDDFSAALARVDSPDRMMQIWLRFGILRNSPEFWPALDWFTAWDQSRNSVAAGRFDLKHYFLTKMLMLQEADLVYGRGIDGAHPDHERH